LLAPNSDSRSLRSRLGKRDQEKAVKSKTFRSRESQHQPSTPSFSLNHVDRLVVFQSSLSTVSGFIRKVRVFSAVLRTTMAGYSGSNGPSNGLPFTVTALNRWSIANKQLPRKSCTSICERELINTAVDKVKVLHVYDFDNTRKFSPAQRTSTSTNFAPSLQQPLTQPKAMERTDHWLFAVARHVNQRRLVARLSNTCCNGRRRRKRRAPRVGGMVE
jgi:hypothetical protein